ncbi:MAG: hypothetical protein RQ750_13155 [Roseovarius sp.]|nr:hypothetical protein [Roseovarius sp.]
MSDEDQNAGHMVWGIPVLRHASGRYQWPDTIKVKAVERVLAGEKVGAIAQEIDANKSLVAKWVYAHGKGGEESSVTGAFVEVIALDGAGPNASSGSDFRSCEIHLGDVRLTVQPGFPIAQLAELLRAVRASQ